MAQNIYEEGEGNEAWDAQFDRIKEVLDSIAYKIVKQADDADFYDTVDLNRIFFNANANYNTFITNQGYIRLTQYNGIKNVKNKKEIRLNPYAYLRGRNLGESNKYYIEEVYE
jgi:hypothetical protein